MTAIPKCPQCGSIHIRLKRSKTRKDYAIGICKECPGPFVFPIYIGDK